MENRALLTRTEDLTHKQAITLKIEHVKAKNEIAPNAKGRARIVPTNKLEDRREHKLITDGDRSQYQKNLTDIRGYDRGNNNQTLLTETKGLTQNQAIALRIAHVKAKNEIAPNAKGRARIVPMNKLEDSREHKLITDGGRSQK